MLETSNAELLLFAISAVAAGALPMGPDRAPAIAWMRSKESTTTGGTPSKIRSCRCAFSQRHAVAEHPELVVLEALWKSSDSRLSLQRSLGQRWACAGVAVDSGLWGAVLVILGIVGFSFSSATGFMLAELVQVPDHDAGFATASALMSSSITGNTDTVGMLMGVAGQIGILLVIGGLVRARIIRFWVLFLVLAGSVVNLALGTTFGTLIADLMLLAVGIWLAISILRTSREKWLGAALVAGPKHTEVAA